MNYLSEIMLPFLGTSIGAMLVFFSKKRNNNIIHMMIISISSGIMLSSAIWSLLIPSIEKSSNILIPTFGFFLGIIFLLLINNCVSENPVNKNKIMILSIIIHNIPEGMAVGVAFASLLNNYMDYSAALMLSIGIAVQNIPEGAIVSLPAYNYNHSKKKSFFIGCLSGIVEPISAVISFLITSHVISLLPWILAFASAAMIYVVVIDLIPEFNNKISIIPFSIGFFIMIILESVF